MSAAHESNASFPDSTHRQRFHMASSGAMVLGQRIAIVGNAGGGKTTLARMLSERLDLPVVHVDSIQFRPNWERTPTAECDAMLERAASKERWIIDGFGSRSVIERRVARADTFIFVDFALWRHYWWAARRQWHARKHQRRELPENCPEFTLRYTRALFAIMWLVHREERPWFLQLLREKARSGRAIHVRTPRQWAELVDSVG